MTRCALKSNPKQIRGFIPINKSKAKQKTEEYFSRRILPFEMLEYFPRKGYFYSISIYFISLVKEKEKLIATRIDPTIYLKKKKRRKTARYTIRIFELNFKIERIIT